jgi:BMFP domain-containing protein YqiC
VRAQDTLHRLLGVAGRARRVAEVEHQLAELRARVAELEARLEEATDPRPKG